MSWLALGLGAAGAAKGIIDAKRNRELAAEHDKFRRVAIENSPWSNMGDPGAAQVGNTSTWSGLLGGATQGALIGSAFGGTGGGQTPKTGAVAMNTNPMQMGLQQQQMPVGMQPNPWMIG